MSSEGLSEEQRTNAVSTLRAVTSISSDSEALFLLRAHDWDLDRAASAFLDDVRPAAEGSGSERETAAVSASASSSQPSYNSAQVPESARSSGIAPPPAPPAAASAQSSSRQLTSQQRPHRPAPRWLIALLSPLRFVWTFLSRVTKSILQALGGPARQIEAMPGENPTHRFLNFFDAKYGPQHPSFLNTSYLQALQIAHTQLKFLLVYVHSESHRLTGDFVREVMSNRRFIEAVDESMLAWAGSVTQRDAAAVQSALRAPALPFLAIVAAPSRPSNDLTRANFGSLLAIRAGSSALVGGGEAAANWVSRVLYRNASILAAVSEQRVERESARLLREQQDAEYAAALEADRLVERQAAEERDKEDKERKRMKEMEVRRERKREALGVEPEKGAGIASLMLRLPDGRRVGRRFSKDEALEKVFDWAEVNGVDIDVACLVVAFPRKKFRYPEDGELSLEKAGLFPSCMLLLEQR